MFKPQFPASIVSLFCSALVTEKSGVPRLPPSNHAGLSNSNLGSEFLTSVVKKNMQLEKELDNIKIKHARAVDDCEEAYDKIKNLESELQKIVKQENDYTNIVIEKLKHEVNKLSTDNEKKVEEIKHLENSLKVKNEVSNQLNKRLGELKIKNDKENAASKKAHKAEIKSWRKELGAERKEKNKVGKVTCKS